MLSCGKYWFLWILTSNKTNISEDRKECGHKQYASHQPRNNVLEDKTLSQQQKPSNVNCGEKYVKFELSFPCYNAMTSLDKGSQAFGDYNIILHARILTAIVFFDAKTLETNSNSCTAIPECYRFRVAHFFSDAISKLACIVLEGLIIYETQRRRIKNW